jgi:acyl-CoA synthetase (NDP forming)
LNDALTALMRPTSIGIVGASAKRPTRGNHVIRNLVNSKFPGKILPIHPQAS